MQVVDALIYIHCKLKKAENRNLNDCMTCKQGGVCHINTSCAPPQVSYQPCPKPPAALPPYQSCPKPSAGLPSYQPCVPPKPAGLPGCSSLLDDPSSSSYSTEVKVTEESGGVIKSLSFQPEPLQTKSERADSYDYRYSYPNTYRYDDY